MSKRGVWFEEAAPQWKGGSLYVSPEAGQWALLKQQQLDLWSFTEWTFFVYQNLASVWVFLQCILCLVVLASCTALILALGQVLISFTSHHPNDVNSGILLATSVSSLAISIFLIIAVTLYLQPRKCLQQHRQQASLVHRFFVSWLII